jgi:hypothetical protein
MAIQKNSHLTIPVKATTSITAELPKTYLLADVSSEVGILDHVSPQGKADLQKLLGDLAAAVLRNSAICEDHPSGAEPDISRSHVREAWDAVLNRSRGRRHQGWRVILEAVYSLCLFVAGVGAANLGRPWGAVLTASGAVGAGVSIAALVLLEDR